MADEIERYLSWTRIDRRDFLKLGITTAGMAAVAACGGSTTGSGGPTGPEFKLGVVLPYSGVYAELGNSITNGMRIYFDSVGNQAGNRKITMVTADEQVALADAVVATKKVVEQDAVDMVAGYVSSPNAAGNRDYLHNLKMPTLIANAGVNSLSRAARSPYIYRTSFSNWQPPQPVGKYVFEKLGKKRIQLGVVAAAGFFVEQDVLAAIGDASPEGAISGLHWALTLTNKENQDFIAKYSKKFNGRQADVFAVQGFDTARVIVEALNATKGNTSNKDGFMSAIAAVKFKSPRGDFKFDPVTHNVIQTIYIRKTVKDPKLGWTNQVIDQYPEVADPGK
ncbi:MAG: hypothetical protein NVS9B11_05140 [Candidatus Dormibacteraceae bacterium]